MVVVSSLFSAPAEGIILESPSTKLFMNNLEVGTATLYITENNVLWGGGVSASGGPSPSVSLLYPDISLHAVQREPSPALYMVLNYELRLPNQPAGAGDSNEGQNEDEEEFDVDDHPITQLRFVPESENDLQAMFSAMSQGQALHPDPQDEVDDDHFMDGEDFDEGKEVQKRWRSIRDSYTKAYRQGKCTPPEQCAPGSRRYQYHRQMSFLLRALQNKKPRYSQDKYESFSEISNSPQHPPPDEIPRIKNEILDKPLDLKTKPDIPDTLDKCNQTIDNQKKLDIKIDANNILPDDHFSDDKMFMNSLLPLFKKMDDDTRLLCRIEVLKIIRYALQGNKCFEALKMAEDSFFKNRISGILTKEEMNKSESTLSMTTRSADGSRPMRRRRLRSPSPLPVPPKRRGPGRPRKIRPPPSDSEEDRPKKHKNFPKLKVSPVEVNLPTDEDSLSKATSVAQLSTPLFMKMYNLERSKPVSTSNIHVSVKTEPVECMETNLLM